jgi:C4-type Zn-finger protein
MSDRRGIKHQGFVEMACPECAATIRTADAAFSMQIEGGVQFQGVPCDCCGATFTVEILNESQTPDPDAP